MAFQAPLEIAARTKLTRIARQQDSKEWKNIGEFELPVLPRIGEHVAVTERVDRPPNTYRVVGILHPAPNKGLIDVLAVHAVYDGTHGDVQNRLLRES